MTNLKVTLYAIAILTLFLIVAKPIFADTRQIMVCEPGKECRMITIITTNN